MMLPAYAEDLLGRKSLTVRPKMEAPTVGFCGWSRPRDFKNMLGTTMKNALVRAKSLLDRRKLAELKGITLRADALDALRKTDGIRCDFIERNSYSGHKDTITVDPEASRREFIANIERSDFVLCVKGDGNFSYRFFETLSMGRIPLLLDTACVLPLEDRIDYDRFVCRVPLAERGDIGTIAKSWYHDLSEQEWATRQREARRAFEEHLSAPVFFRRLFTELL